MDTMLLKVVNRKMPKRSKIEGAVFWGHNGSHIAMVGSSGIEPIQLFIFPKEVVGKAFHVPISFDKFNFRYFSC